MLAAQQSRLLTAVLIGGYCNLVYSCCVLVGSCCVLTAACCVLTAACWVLKVLGWVKSGVRDFSISRAAVEWGIRVPQDPRQTVYVWFDALLGEYMQWSGVEQCVVQYVCASSVYSAFSLHAVKQNIAGADVHRMQAVLLAPMHLYITGLLLLLCSLCPCIAPVIRSLLALSCWSNCCRVHVRATSTK